MPVLVVSLFVAHRIKAGDFWGAGFGAMALAYALVAPHEEVGAARWRVYSIRVLTVMFVCVAILAIWRTLSK